MDDMYDPQLECPLRCVFFFFCTKLNFAREYEEFLNANQNLTIDAGYSLAVRNRNDGEVTSGSW